MFPGREKLRNMEEVTSQGFEWRPWKCKTGCSNEDAGTSQQAERKGGEWRGGGKKKRKTEHRKLWKPFKDGFRK